MESETNLQSSTRPSQLIIQQNYVMQYWGETTLGIVWSKCKNKRCWHADIQKANVNDEYGTRLSAFPWICSEHRRFLYTCAGSHVTRIAWERPGIPVCYRYRIRSSRGQCRHCSRVPRGKWGRVKRIPDGRPEPIERVFVWDSRGPRRFIIALERVCGVHRDTSLGSKSRR